VNNGIRPLVHAGTLVVLWVALWGDLSVGNVVAGVLVALAVLKLSPLPRDPSPPGHFRPLAVLRFAVFFAGQLVLSNLQIAREVLRRDQRRTSGVLAVPMDGLSDRLVTLVANAYTLTPGSITIEVHRQPSVVYVHLLRLEDAEATRRQLLHLGYLAVLAFGTAEARQHLEARGST
jgi:multicomponent Na+:H+ antiporter subunit E